MTDPALLADHRFLRDFTPEEVGSVAEVASPCELKAGASVWECGAKRSGLYLIVRGRVELSRATEFPERRVVMGIFGPGSVVGETIFFGSTGGSLTALAMEPTTLAEIDEAGIEKLAAINSGAYDKLMRAVLKVLSKRLVQAYERMSSVF